MISLGVVLTIVAAAGWSGLDVARKFAVEHMKPESVLMWLVAGQTVLFAGWAAYTGAGIERLHSYAWLALLSIALNVVANLAYLHAIRVSPFSLMIPLLSFVPVFTVAAANPLLGEMPSSRQLLGIALVVMGTLALGAGSASSDAPGGVRRRGARAWIRGLLRERGTVFMLVTALCWALTMVVDKLALSHAAPEVHGVVLNLGMAISLGVYLAARGRLAELRDGRGHVGVLAAAVVPRVVLTGGVAANQGLRAYAAEVCRELSLELFAPPIKRCTDNGSMIAYAGYLALASGQRDDFDLAPRAGWPVEED